MALSAKSCGDISHLGRLVERLARLKQKLFATGVCNVVLLKTASHRVLPALLSGRIGDDDGSLAESAVDVRVNFWGFVGIQTASTFSVLMQLYALGLWTPVPANTS